MHLVMSMSYLVVLLAEAAVDALGHVDVVSGGSPGTVAPLLCLNSDSLSRAHSLTQLAGNASLLSTGVPSQCVLPTESGGERPLLKGVVDGGGLFEDVPQGHRHASAQLGDKQAVSSIVGHLTP